MKKDEHEEIDFEPEEEMGAAAALDAKLQKLKDELEAAKKERQEYLDGWQRCKADAINMRKDVESRAARSAEMLREALVHDIIPALDSFDMAALSGSWSEVSDGFRSGMEQVRNQLLGALKSHGVERFGKIGERIDHSAYETVEESGDFPGESGTVAKILRYGYKTNGKVLRAAQVIAKK